MSSPMGCVACRFTVALALLLLKTVTVVASFSPETPSLIFQVVLHVVP